jgi:hypothetical protein
MATVYQLPGGALPPNTVAYNRWIIWPQLVQAVTLRPWWGWGIGQVSTAHNAVVDAYPMSESYTYAHNVLLDLALGLGLPLTALFVLVLSLWAWARVRSINHHSTWYCMAIVIPVAAHSLVEFPFAYAYFLAPVMFAIGAIEGLTGQPPAMVMPAISARVFLTAVTVLLVWSSVEYLAIEEDFRIVRFESLRVGQTPRDYERPSVHVFTQLDALLRGGRLAPRPNMPKEDIELTKTVALRYPWPATQNRYALALALNGNSAEATRQLRVMRAQHGERAYAKIKDAWTTLANEQFPQLRVLQLP